MAEGVPDYDELRLRIERGQQQSYRVVAFGPDGSTAEGAFDLPVTATELDNFILRIAHARRSRGVRALPSSQMEQAKGLGSQLFDMLFHGDVRDVYLGARRLADGQGRGLRVTLYLTGVPELMEVPWEFLYERPAFLSQSIYTPVVRSLDLKTIRSPRKVTLPLQILGVVSRPDGWDDLDVGEERTKLEEALRVPMAEGLVELRWAETATLAELERTIGAPGDIHVLHLVGHGAYDPRTANGTLILEDQRRASQEVSGEELGFILQDERSLRLVVLNSCEGARTSHIDPFSSVATALVECGLPAVIGMQFEITDEAAITFAQRLYTALGQGFPVDAALAHARKAIFAAGNDVEFGTPVLFLRSGDARLFDIDVEPQTTPREPGSQEFPRQPDRSWAMGSDDVATQPRESKPPKHRPEAAAVLTLVRTKQMAFGRLATIHLEVDDRRVASVKNGGWTEVEVSPGVHSLRAVATVLGGTGGSTPRMTVNLGAGSRVKYRVWCPVNWSAHWNTLGLEEMPP